MWEQRSVVFFLQAFLFEYFMSSLILNTLSDGRNLPTLDNGETAQIMTPLLDTSASGVE